MSDTQGLILAIAQEVEVELDKRPIIKMAIHNHIQSDDGAIYPTDMVTYIGASKSQKEFVSQLIDKYGDSVVAQAFGVIFGK